MRRPVHWTQGALDDIKKQVAFIARDDRAAALRVADRIRDTAVALGQRAIGRAGRVAGTYEKSVVGLPYVIAYSLADQAGHEAAVVILHVIHTARDWPPGQWPD